jgi:hypothetical protein
MSETFDCLSGTIIFVYLEVRKITLITADQFTTLSKVGKNIRDHVKFVFGTSKVEVSYEIKTNPGLM